MHGDAIRLLRGVGSICSPVCLQTLVLAGSFWVVGRVLERGMLPDLACPCALAPQKCLITVPSACRDVASSACKKSQSGEHQTRVGKTSSMTKASSLRPRWESINLCPVRLMDIFRLAPIYFKIQIIYINRHTASIQECNRSTASCFVLNPCFDSTYCSLGCLGGFDRKVGFGIPPILHSSFCRAWGAAHLRSRPEWTQTQRIPTRSMKQELSAEGLQGLSEVTPYPRLLQWSFSSRNVRTAWGRNVNAFHTVQSMQLIPLGGLNAHESEPIKQTHKGLYAVAPGEGGHRAATAAPAKSQSLREATSVHHPVPGDADFALLPDGFACNQLPPHYLHRSNFLDIPTAACESSNV